MLGLNTSEDALLGSQSWGALGSKSNQGADFALEDKGVLGLNVSEDAVLGLENFISASKYSHSKSILNAEDSFSCHCEEHEVRRNNPMTLKKGKDIGFSWISSTLAECRLLWHSHKSAPSARYPDLLGLRPRRHPYGNPPRRHSHTFRLLRLRLRMQGHTHRVPLCGSLCIAMTDYLCTNPNATDSKTKCGFTLAEVLITLGIIGVVAALTIPTLMQKNNDKETISRVKKVYNTLANAVDLMVLEEGNPRTWNLNFDSSPEDATIIAEKLKPYMNVAKDCGVADTTTTGCVYAGIYKNLNGANRSGYIDPYYGARNNFYKLSLSDGSAVMFRSAKDNKQNEEYSIFFIVDVNGLKGPNQVAKDTFFFWINLDGKLVPHNSGECSKSGMGDACTSWILQNDNMDYPD